MNPTYHSIECRCGSRRTQRTGRLKYHCHDCHTTYHYRLSHGVLLPFSKPTADALDERRAS